MTGDLAGKAVAGALKRGRDQRWPYVPIWRWEPADGSRGYTTQVRGLAYATRDEAVAAAERHLDINRMPR